MTYKEFIISSAPIPTEEKSMLNIRHNIKTGMYYIWGVWQDQCIDIIAWNYKNAAAILKAQHNLCIPARKDLIFSHRYKGYAFALLQGFLPGSAVVDVSDMFVRV